MGDRMSSPRRLPVKPVTGTPENTNPSATSGLELEFAQLSDPGRVRGHNEDYLGHVAPGTSAQARAQGWLFAVADGVGGHAQGEVASRLAIETLTAGFREAVAGEPHA